MRDLSELLFLSAHFLMFMFIDEEIGSHVAWTDAALKRVKQLLFVFREFEI